MRYFLITFSLSEKFSLGSITLSSVGFFSYEYLLESIRKINSSVKSVVVVNIFEFKNEDDYNAYRGEDDMYSEQRFQQWFNRLLVHTVEKMRLDPTVIDSFKTNQDFFRKEFESGNDVPKAIMNYFE